MPEQVEVGRQQWLISADFCFDMNQLLRNRGGEATHEVAFVDAIVTVVAVRGYEDRRGGKGNVGNPNTYTSATRKKCSLY
jgi:hypothetical protein